MSQSLRMVKQGQEKLTAWEQPIGMELTVFGVYLKLNINFSAEDDPVLEGVIPRSVKDIFSYIAENQNVEFLVKVSYMELYNEQLFDLLSGKPRREDNIVDIREDGNKGIKIAGLTETPIASRAWRKP